MMYVDLLHDPALPDDGLQEAQRQFRSVGMFTRIVWHAYTPFLQDLAMITGLSKMPMDPEDWVIVADMDEYFTFGDKTNVQEAVQAMEQEGASFAVGELLPYKLYTLYTTCDLTYKSLPCKGKRQQHCIRPPATLQHL